MSITRTYTTESDCTRFWVSDSFDQLPSWLVTDRDDFSYNWQFYGIDDETDEFGLVEEPMWSTYFMPNNSWDANWLKENKEAVAREGFTIICMDEELFALGIDGAGYDFYEEHWIPLYRLRGFQWHDDPDIEAQPVSTLEPDCHEKIGIDVGDR